MNRGARRWRDLAAVLATGVGLGWVALLWFQPLTAPTLLGALLGTVYLFIATANIGCLAHLSSGTTIPVRHWVELLQ